jgi:hypothetical protein
MKLNDHHNATPAGKNRARGSDVPFDGEPGNYNAITDVPGVEVGYATLIEGADVRTGVTAILPRGKDQITTPVFAGCHSLNGNGELTGTIWIEEAGRCDGPRYRPGCEHQVDGGTHGQPGTVGAPRGRRNLRRIPE